MTFASLVPLDTAVIAQVGVLAVSLRLADRAISLALQRPMPTMVAVGASIVGLRVLNARYQKRLADLVRRQDDSNVSAGDSAVDEDQPRVVVVDTSGVLDDEARRLKNMLLGIHMAGLVVVTAGMFFTRGT
ncbi:GPI-anchored surface protein, putative [Bodo saltans]|uniref:GPI-anchored surface protein, putative n=1 Tax=Bodo saltans TaxID=75058 RepID=A0A0S4J834_BODSA|nr:GPI-anchored surface protein, putative [Bodo saltans]|eukprot:CUG86331.1 GPI-anchored surface protein, putative [Bodo saltans]